MNTRTIRRDVLRALTALGATVVLAATAGPAFAQTYGGSGTLSTSSQTVSAGGTFTASGDGVAPGSTVELELRSDPISLGSAVADSAGHFTKQVTLPSTVSAGDHLLTAIGTAPDGSSLVISTSITVGAGSAALPRTGSNSSSFTLIAIILIAGGTAIVLFARTRLRRRSAA